jgi:CRP/FNR family transcriptional regulator, cyclic AMP receptor protein
MMADRDVRGRTRAMASQARDAVSTASRPDPADWFQILAKNSLLTGLSDSALARVKQVVQWVDCEPGHRLFEHGHATTEVYFVISGALRVVSQSGTGREVAFAELNPGAYFGELSALDGKERSATVIATVPSIVAALPRNEFLMLVRENPDVALRLLARLASVVRELDSRVLDLSSMSTTQRIYVEVLRLAEPAPENDGSWIIDPMPNHKELAALVGAEPEDVARAIGRLFQVGVARRVNRMVRILDRSHVEALALQEN